MQQIVRERVLSRLAKVKCISVGCDLAWKQHLIFMLHNTLTRTHSTDSLILSAGCSNASLCFIYIRTTNRIHCVQCIDEHQGRFLCGRLWVGSGHNKTKTKISKQRRNNNSWELENLFEVYFIKKSSSFESLLLWHYISKVLWVYI